MQSKLKLHKIAIIIAIIIISTIVSTIIVQGAGVLGQNQSDTIYFEINATDLSLGMHSTEIEICADGCTDVLIPVSINVAEKQRLVISMTKIGYGILSASVKNIDTEPLYIKLELYTEYGFFFDKQNDSESESLRLAPGETGFVEIHDLNSFGIISANATASIPGFTPVNISRKGIIISRLILLLF
jgi:hypothetical protein